MTNTTETAADSGAEYTENDVTRPAGGMFDVETVRLALGDSIERAERAGTWGSVRERLTLAALYHLLQTPEPLQLIKTGPEVPAPHMVNGLPPEQWPPYVQFKRHSDGSVWIHLDGHGPTSAEDARLAARALLSAADLLDAQAIDPT